MRRQRAGRFVFRVSVCVCETCVLRAHEAEIRMRSGGAARRHECVTILCVPTNICPLEVLLCAARRARRQELQHGSALATTSHSAGSCDCALGWLAAPRVDGWHRCLQHTRTFAVFVLNLNNQPDGYLVCIMRCRGRVCVYNAAAIACERRVCGVCNRQLYTQ